MLPRLGGIAHCIKSACFVNTNIKARVKSPDIHIKRQYLQETSMEAEMGASLGVAGHQSSTRFTERPCLKT